MYLAPGNQTLLGLDPVEGPFTNQNTLLDFSYGLGPIPESNVPMTEGDDPHDAVFVEPAAQASIFTFLQEGVTASFCEGACDSD